MLQRKTAVIVDDVELNRELLRDILDEGYDILEACNGAEALEVIHAGECQIGVLLLDLVMPRIDGFGVLEQLKKESKIDRFPILIISGEKDIATEEKCLSYGVTDFIRKPFTPSLVRHRVDNAVAFFDARNRLEKIVEEKTEQLQERNKQLARTNENTIELLGNVVEARSMESGTHIRRVKGFTRLLGKYMQTVYPEMNITDEEISSWAKASAMHDVGKIKVPDHILLKPGKLTAEEFEEIKKHTIYGCEVMEISRHMWEKDYYELCWQICRFHHEKWDGSGYPDGLKGDEIPLVAQVVAVADCYDALTTERVYKRAFTTDEAYDMIMGGKCGAFSPKVLRVLEICRSEFACLAVELSEN